jgi:hypothetical protein
VRAVPEVGEEAGNGSKSWNRAAVGVIGDEDVHDICSLVTLMGEPRLWSPVAVMYCKVYREWGQFREEKRLTARIAAETWLIRSFGVCFRLVLGNSGRRKKGEGEWLSEFEGRITIWLFWFVLWTGWRKGFNLLSVIEERKERVRLLMRQRRKEWIVWPFAFWLWTLFVGLRGKNLPWEMELMEVLKQNKVMTAL